MIFKPQKSYSFMGWRRWKLFNMIVMILVILSLFSGGVDSTLLNNDNNNNNNNNNVSSSSVELPDHHYSSFNEVSGSGSGSVSSGCTLLLPKSKKETIPNPPPVKLQLKHNRRRRTSTSTSTSGGEKSGDEGKQSVSDSTARDVIRIQTLHKRINNIQKKKKKNSNNNNNNKKRLLKRKEKEIVDDQSDHHQQQLMVATLESGVTLGSGEYFIDVFVGNPPKHLSLILDTGSDLNWIQCLPCYDCFEQIGPYYNPQHSTSFKNITCHDPRCNLVSSPHDYPCDNKNNNNQTCPYFYWYGDSSNTTGDFALETFTVNLTSPSGNSEFRQVENVMFGCGHWNRGLFHGAAGLLGLGRGPLSFSSQLQSLYGHSFSYCLVDRNSNSSVTSKLIFGEDKDLLSHPELNFTSLVAGKQNPVDTFYYVHIKSILVGGEPLNIPEETWNLSPEGVGGTIVDSGTTLSYFADPAYKTIKEAFVNKVKGHYPLVNDFPILDPCYNVSGVRKLELPTFSILFADGAFWNFPVENYFIRLDPEEVVCLAILGTPRSALSIIGNYQQQNFHIMYDTNKSRLGFAPTRCADV